MAIRIIDDKHPARDLSATNQPEAAEERVFLYDDAAEVSGTVMLTANRGYVAFEPGSIGFKNMTKFDSQYMLQLATGGTWG